MLARVTKSLFIILKYPKASWAFCHSATTYRPARTQLSQNNILGKNINNKTSSNKAAHFLGTHKQLDEQVQSAQLIFTSCPTVLNQEDSGGGLLQHTLKAPLALKVTLRQQASIPQLLNTKRPVTQTWYQKELFPDQQKSENL